MSKRFENIDYDFRPESYWDVSDPGIILYLLYTVKERVMDNMKTIKFILPVLAPAMSMLITGCGSTIPVSAHKYPAVSVDSVQMLYQEPKRPYEVIALVGTEGGLKPFVADIAGLRKQAAQVGADAVIVTEAKNTTAFQHPSASGKAIKWAKRDEVQQ